MHELCSEEEVSFNRTLDKGIARFKEAAKAAKAKGQKYIDSEDAFAMWDTHGFPVDLTQVSTCLSVYTRVWVCQTHICDNEASDE